ncbi:hypothetical protein H5410_060863 [Solanum commersonii]|uniref:Uncharacterized protein n=1 Tax=Solanum commersonii TaxID=4109 RepID=A0A9J5W6L5_SOLCO|nr:hypothetical protein H5410_060863 [Solanum commersonii]
MITLAGKDLGIITLADKYLGIIILASKDLDIITLAGKDLRIITHHMSHRGSISLTSHDHFPNLTHKTRLTTPFCSDKGPDNFPNEPGVQNDDTIRFKEGKYAALLKPSSLNSFE